MLNMIAQGIGVLGLVAYLVSFQVKNNRRFFLWQMLGCGLFSVQMALLGAVSGSISLVVTLLRSLLMCRYNDWIWVRSKATMAVFCVLFALSSVLTWAGPQSLLPLIACEACTVVYWSNNAGYIRLVNLLIGSPAWLVYDILVGSWGGIGNELVTMGSALVSIHRFGWKRLADKDSDFSK